MLLKSEKMSYYPSLPHPKAPITAGLPHSENAQYFRWERVVPGDPVFRRPRFGFGVRVTSSDWRARARTFWSWRRGWGEGRAPALYPSLMWLSPLPRRASRPPAYPPIAVAGMRWGDRARFPTGTWHLPSSNFSL